MWISQNLDYPAKRYKSRISSSICFIIIFNKYIVLSLSLSHEKMLAKGNFREYYWNNNFKVIGKTIYVNKEK